MQATQSLDTLSNQNTHPSNTQNQCFEFLIFRLGKQALAIPMQWINYVSPVAPDFSYRGESVARHFLFEGQPISYISLWDVLDIPSDYLEYELLLGMLPQRLNDHLEWMHSLLNSIQTGTPFTKTRNHYECAFGKWFYSYKTNDKRLSLLLQQFETPHAAIHALADTLLKLSADGHITEAVQAYEEAEHTTLASLMKLFKSTEILVTELQRRVAIIVSSEGERCALGVDGIIEIANISSNNIRKSSKIDLRNPRNHATSGVLILNNQQIVPILDWQSLAGAIPSDETNSQTL